MRKNRLIFLFLAACLLSGCGRPAAPEEPAQSLPEAVRNEAVAPAETQPPTAPQQILDIALEAKAMVYAPPPPVFVPQAQASGLLEARCDEAVVDYSHTEEGYVMAQYTAETDKRLKVRVIGPATVYTYNLTPGEWTVFPLSDGNGPYQVVIYRNTTENRYASILAAEFTVALTDEFAPFLRPNQYVNYSEASRTVAMGAQLCGGLSHPLEKVAAVYDYVVANLSYDTQKAETVTSGYLPVLDEVLSSGKGICFDYAALMTAMLRSQEVPCKLVVGYAGSTYHAWISVWTEEDGWVDGAIFFDGHSWKRMDPTFASSGQRSPEIMDFIEHGSYSVKYLY